jgi:hypothetical protein
MSKMKLPDDTLIANSTLLPSDIVVMLSACIGKVSVSNLGGILKYTQIRSVKCDLFFLSPTHELS